MNSLPTAFLQTPLARSKLSDMGCAASNIGGDEAVKLCKDRKKYIKQAINRRNRFASDHMAYIQSMKRISAALMRYTEADGRHEFLYEYHFTPASISLKKLRRELSEIRLKPLKPKQMGSAKTTVRVVNHLRSGQSSSVSIEEEPELSESARIGTFDPFYGSSMNQASLWDHLWNLFPSLDSYGYPSWTNYDMMLDDDIDTAELSKIREEEGIPELETVTENKEKTESEKAKAERKHAGVQVDVHTSVDSDLEFEKAHEAEKIISEEAKSIEASGSQQDADLESPGLAAYASRRATSLIEVMEIMERQFMRICESANEVSVMLEASGAQRTSAASTELAGESNSLVRFRQACSSKANNIRSQREYLGRHSKVPISHLATLQRLYEWEKKLYEEVKTGESVRIAYEKKCMQLKNHDINGEDPSAVEQTRVCIRHLYTHFKVYIRTIESVSKRIETVRDVELCPQLVELIKRISRMWKTMEDGHRIQKRAISDAKLLVLSGAAMNTAKPPQCILNLAAEVNNWRLCFANWIKGMRSYTRAISNWASRCVSPELPDGTKLPPVYGVCTWWSRLSDSIREKRAMEGMAFFTAAMSMVSAQRLKAEQAGLPPNEAASVAEKLSEIEPRVLCVGMSAAVGSMAEFALGAAQGYDALLKRYRSEEREWRNIIK